MKLWYNSVALHPLGEVTLAQQASQFSPDDMPQKETRTLTLRIDYWQQSFGENYALVTAARDALRAQERILKLQEEDNADLTEGEIVLNRTVTVISCDLPENPNAWGTYQQQITIVVRYEINDLADDDTHLKATFKRTSSLGGPLVLGSVTSAKTAYRAKIYSEFKNLRERSSGAMTLTGAFPANTEASLSARRISLLGTLDLWNAEVNDRDGVLTYGAFFNQLVRVESFDAEINQAVTAIKWTITVGYTIFPDESGYAAADFKITEQKDMETGEFVLMISGKIAAATELIARAKLDTVRTASLASNVGYGAAGLISSEIDVGKLSVDDSADAPDGIVFIELNFRETYRKKGNILSWSLTISDDDDVRGGLIRRTYSGSVTAGITGAETAENAYRKALDKARLLGDNKHPFRLSGKVSRGDRKTGVGVQEFVRCEFSFEYQLKGKRIFLEVNSEVATETFGEDTEKVSGFVVAETFILANAAYNTNVRGAYNSPVQRLIRGESKSQSRVKIQNARYNVALVPVSTTGYSPDPAGAEGLSTEDISAIPLEPVFDMWVRLDFSFNVFNKKTAGYAIKYGVDVDVDYVALRKTTTVSGTFFGPDAFLINAEDYSMPPPTSEPALEAFLASLNYGKHINSKRTTDHEHNGTTDYRLHVNFSETYVDKLTSAAQLVQCQVEEETLCSGARFVAQPLPDNEDVVQNCGHEHGTRTVSGTCLATTEGVAMTWVNAQRTGLFNVADALYELPQRLRKSWEFLPLEADPIPGTDEGAGTPVRPGNAMFVRIDFTFTEIVPRMEYS